MKIITGKVNIRFAIKVVLERDVLETGIVNGINKRNKSDKVNKYKGIVLL